MTESKSEIDDLSKLIKRRGIIKGLLTKFGDYVEELYSTEKSSLRYKELDLKLKKIQVMLDDYDEIQSQIDILHADSELQIRERDAIENQFIKCLAMGQEIMESYTSNILKETHDSSSKTNCNFDSIKLPTINLPSFDGNYLHWLEYRDSFESMIHNNDNIPVINKFHYLRSSLQGSASVVIKSIEFSAQTYHTAWTILCQRYNNNNILINNHLKALLSLESLIKESHKALRFFVDHCSKHLRALENLGQPTNKWDTLVIFIFSAKLDISTSRKWEEYKSNQKLLPTLEEFYSFLRNRADVLETTLTNRVDSRDFKFKPKQFKPTNQSFVVSVDKKQSPNNCIICDDQHFIHRCPKFNAMSVDDRQNESTKHQLCCNCLRKGHNSYKCNLKGLCRICRKKHNTLLHKDINTEGYRTSNSLSMSLTAVSTGQVLLCTASVTIIHNNKAYIARALLDTGSQSSLITEKLKSRIGLDCRSETINISGINGNASNIVETCHLTVKSRCSLFNINVKFLVIPKISGDLPNSKINIHNLNLPSNIKLADPNFYHPSEIDILLGADVYYDIINNNIIRLGHNRPNLQDSKLGWLVAGPLAKSQNTTRVHCYFSQEIRDSLEKFWHIDDLPYTKSYSVEEKNCESNFVETMCRLPDGRFRVSMPLKAIPEEVLGDTFYIAKKCFLNLEKKFDRFPELKQNYKHFLKEYSDLGHLRKVDRPKFGYFMPHHAVLKEKSETTKLRVVFNASFKTSTGTSLNDIQMVGPVIHSDLISILLRFRQHKFVLFADIEKMYRQIEISPSQRHLQLILWRDDKNLPIDVLQLQTVTYGTASAPFLSTRCLLQLALDCPDKIISDVIKNDFYIDDVTTGSDSIQGLKHIYYGLLSTLQSACMPLRKFRTNCPELFNNNDDTLKSFDVSKESSVLGLNYAPKFDTLQFSANLTPASQITKKSVISTTCKIFDPLGLLSPCVIVAKIFLQRLWQAKLDWDDPVPDTLSREWSKLLSEFSVLFEIRIPRGVLCDNPINTELHCFVDASQQAYAACIYLRSKTSDGQVVVKLLCAKARVAPIKPITIPRLELCGALLGARLSIKVLQSSRCVVTHKYIWTDSTVVLGWLNTQAKDLKAFVCNRVHEINELTSDFTFRHVPSDQNPADMASRGINPKQLQTSLLWWEAPTFLKLDSCQWPEQTHTQTYTHLPDLKQTLKSSSIIVNTLILSSEDNLIQFIQYSNFNKLKRIYAYVLRFINNSNTKCTKLSGPLDISELNKALSILIKFSQAETFYQEINLISNKLKLHKKSKLLPLSPFVDSLGVLRVGGRIRNSNFDYDKKHPIVLDAKHHLTKLIMMHEHLRMFHAGPQLLLASIREQFWPIGGRWLARRTVKQCIICTKLRAETVQPIMGDLPAERSNPTFPFHSCGVDMAGPFMISSRKGKGNRISKAYLCIYVCLSTKAVHLELVSDLSTESFILSLRRFVSRRGKPAVIYCDNGTNFKGANNEISRLLRSSRQDVSDFASNDGIKFMFSPAYSPHFGGIWEAGVKSAKNHLRRVAGNASLTFEELTTLFSQIEAILNSRPLTPLTSDPNDTSPLTPGHFLIGRPLTSIPTRPMDMKRPNRYQYIEKLRQHFWLRWRREYVAELQERSKWRHDSKNALQVGDLVILKEDNLPPLQWRLGRIARLHPGLDGISRVADVTTIKGTFRRAVNKMCPLQPVSTTTE